MHDAHRRIKKIEKQLHIGRRQELQQVIVRLTMSKEVAPDIPEDFHDWITYRKAHKEALEQLERTGCELFLFVADPKKEYQAQQATKNDQKQRIPGK
jgi:ferric-dicitrate binding protein FerR (iron transport regulator)